MTGVQTCALPISADTRLVNVHIQRLRGKIEEDADEPAIILTVRGVGYRAIA